MKITLKQAKEMKCPLCGKTMIFCLPHEVNYRAGTTVHSFSCGCGVRWTSWDFKVTGLKSVYSKIQRERAKKIKKQFEIFKKQKSDKELKMEE